MISRRAAYTIHVVPILSWASQNVPGASEEGLRLRLVTMLDRLLDRLLDPDDLSLNTLLLDGQTHVIEAYLALRPERFDQIETLVQDGKLWLGPWYVQPDCDLGSIESLIRNLSIGLRTARTFGAALEIGYWPQSFGLNRSIEHLPQLLRGFGLESALLASTDESAEAGRVEFVWQSPDGSQVMCVQACQRRQLDVSALQSTLGNRTASGHLLALLRVADPTSATPESLDRLPEVIYAANQSSANTIVQSSLPGYFAALRPLGRVLPVAQPALLTPTEDQKHSELGADGRWERIQSIERQLISQAEPLCAWAEWLPDNAQPGQLFRLHNPRSALELAWRELLYGCRLAGVPDISGSLASSCMAHLDRAEQIGQWLAAEASHALGLPLQPGQSLFDHMIRVNNPAFALTAIKLPDDPERGGLIARGWNGGETTQRVLLSPWHTFAGVDVLRLDESPTGGKLAIEADGSIDFRAAPHRLLSFWFHD